MDEPRRSTDDERDPLLGDHVQESPPPTFLERVAAVTQEPLTPLSQFLFIAVIVLLLLSSVFIGLWAGVNHKLKLEKEKHGDGGTTTQTTTTTTAVIPSITTQTTTQVVTTTWASTETTTTRTTATTVIPAPTPSPTQEVCLSSQCILLSASILSSIDISQDPCESFYDFANGGWLNSHVLPSGKASWGMVEILANQNRRLIQEILEANSSISSAPHHPLSKEQLDYDASILSKLRGLYNSCMDEKQLNHLGQDPLIRVARIVRKLFREKGTTIEPQSEDEDEDIPVAQDLKGTGLTAAVAYLHSRGIDALFGYEIEGDLKKDPNLFTLWFLQPLLGLPSKEYYKDEAVVELYQTTIERLLFTLLEGMEDEHAPTQTPIPKKENLLQSVDSPVSETWPPWPWPPWGRDGDDKKRHANNTQRARELAKEVLEFENKIAKASLNHRDTISVDPLATYNPMPLSNLSAAVPQIHFGDYLSAFYPRSFPAEVIVAQPAYFATLPFILEDTGNDTVEAYLLTRAALQLAPLLSPETEAWKAVRALNEKLGGLKKGAVVDRAEFCVEHVERAMGYAVGRYFVQMKFPEKSGEKVTKIITDVVKAFKERLPLLKWMDEESATVAAEKADAIRVKVGFPLSPDLRDPKSIYMFYLPLKIRDDAFFSNLLTAASIEVSREWLQLGKRRNPDSWDLALSTKALFPSTWRMFPSTVNAEFIPPANEIVFPAGILLPPFFSQEWPGYILYGAFGSVAAHELTHAFDSSGRLYNQHGKLEKWWSDSTSEGFKVRQDCIEKQFSEYTVDDGKGGHIHVNGSLTSGENIGDSGVIHSYNAWKAQFHASLEVGTEYLLPGLNFTREQLFFVSFARIWAEKSTPANDVRSVFTDPHSPYRHRVDGTMRNMPEFAKAFRCSPNAKLNPPMEKRCLFWQD